MIELVHTPGDQIWRGAAHADHAQQRAADGLWLVMLGRVHWLEVGGVLLAGGDAHVCTDP